MRRISIRSVISIRTSDSIIELLKKHKRYENTMIVYMADHGYCLGHHGRFEKHCGYDPALRVPLIMRWPGRIRQGVVRDMTESVDVPHTILDMLGAPDLPVKHGQSLRPYLEGKTPGAPRTHIFSEYLENEEAFVTNRHAQIHLLLWQAGADRRVQDGSSHTGALHAALRFTIRSRGVHGRRGEASRYCPRDAEL